MTEINSRDNNPVPGIDYSEIHIPDEQNLGTGTFKTVLEPNAMAKINPIISTIINEPVFKLFVNINLAIEEVTVLLGKADESPPVSREVFKLPKEFNVSDVQTFDVAFKDWKIKRLELNGNSLEKVLVD
jgi:hypothetical protein